MAKREKTILEVIKETLATITPGQWRWDEIPQYETESCYITAEGESGFIAEIASYHNNENRKPNLANATLIVNAPTWINLLVKLADATGTFFEKTSPNAPNFDTRGQKLAFDLLRIAYDNLQQPPPVNPNAIVIQFTSTQLDLLRAVYQCQVDGKKFISNSRTGAYKTLQTLQLNGLVDISIINHETDRYNFQAIVTRAGAYILGLKENPTNEEQQDEYEPVKISE